MFFFVHNIKTKNHKRVYSILSTIVWVFRNNIKTKNHKRVYSILSTIVWVFRTQNQNQKSQESVFDIIDHSRVFRIKQYPKQKSKDFPGVMSLSTGF